MFGFSLSVENPCQALIHMREAFTGHGKHVRGAVPRHKTYGDTAAAATSISKLFSSLKQDPGPVSNKSALLPPITL